LIEQCCLGVCDVCDFVDGHAQLEGRMPSIDMQFAAAHADGVSKCWTAD
jgi:hypothetical protein